MKVTKSEDNLVEFDNGLKIIGDGDQDCCAINYLDFEQLPVGTELKTMTATKFLEAITLKGDGFSVKDINSVPKWVQARSEQNGYYSSMTTLVLKYGGQRIEAGRLAGEME